MAFINETTESMTTWIDNIVCYLYGDDYYGAYPENVVGGMVELNNANPANLQIFQLASRTNYLKLNLEDLISQIVTTKTPNKILRLNDNAKFIADIDNVLTTSQQIIVTDTQVESYIQLLYADIFKVGTFNYKRTDGSFYSLLEDIDDVINLRANSYTTTKLLNPISIKHSDTSNVVLEDNLFDLSEDVILDINLRDQEVTRFASPEVVPFGTDANIFYAFEVTNDARIKRAWNSVNPASIRQTDSYKFVRADQITNWDSKVDAGFIPPGIYNENYFENNEIPLFTFNYGWNLGNLNLKSSTIGIKASPTQETFDHSFRFDTTNLSGESYVHKLFVNFLGSEYELVGTHNFDKTKYAQLFSPNFIGVPTVPTAEVNLNETSTQIANLTYVYNAIKSSDEDKWTKYQEKIDFLLNNKFHTYNPEDCLIYQDIMEAKQIGLIKPGINAGTYDEQSFGVTPWYGEHMIKYGDNHNFEIKVLVPIQPIDYDTIWVRVSNDRFITLGIKHGSLIGSPLPFNSSTSNTLARYSAGFTKSISFTPDGAVLDSNSAYHHWIPIAVDKTVNSNTVTVNNVDYREVVLYGGTTEYNGNIIESGDVWISGLAFSLNPFNHTMVQGYGVAQGLNLHESHGIVSTNENLASTDYWNDLGYFVNAGVRKIRIPVVNYENETNDRLLYIVLDSTNYNPAHKAIYCNGVEIERFRNTYINPFEKHFNNSKNSKYLAARIPADIIKNSKGFLEIVFDLTKTTDKFFFREIGVHNFIP